MIVNHAPQNLVMGALVQWTEAKGYGVITGTSARVIHVRWDEEGHPPQFSATDPPLQRVQFQGAQQVQRKATGERIILQGMVEAPDPVWRCLVVTGSGSPVTTNVPEADLRPIALTDPLERFRAGEIGSSQQYRLQEVTRWYGVMHRNDDLVTLGHVQVDIKPHQVSVVHKVVSHYPHRFLLCDEVGLGKTIEAGMALKELRARGSAQRVLIIVPPNLIRQWQFEMKTKFNESFAVLNTATVRFLEGQGYADNPFVHPEFSDSVLCSAHWIANPKWAKLCSEVDWDLVILDEAHHARSRRYGSRVTTTRLYRLVRDLAPPEHVARRGMLFLTATPMQLDAHELYSLVELLDPTLFPSEEAFEKHRRAVPGLSMLVERIHTHGFPLPDEDPDQTTEQVAAWLNRDAAAVRSRLEAGQDEVTALAHELADCHRLSEVLIRNRKAKVGGFMPRAAYRWEVDLTAEEKAALRAVEEYVQYGYQLAEGRKDNAIGFVMVVFQQLMSSSIAAIRESLHRRRDKVRGLSMRQESAHDLEDWLAEDRDASDVVEAGGVADHINQELKFLDEALNVLAKAKRDSKAEVLVAQLTRLFQEFPEEKVLVFTEFRETQRHLAELLAARHWGVHLFHGQLKPEDKDRAVENFRQGSGPHILVSTEAGGEGRNLQFCHLLVNYDLPWNPMKVEQRIGRIDRIGQERKVEIFNFKVKGTIEERVLDVLEHRIRVFEETVGGLDPILGETESDLRKIMREAEANRSALIEAMGRRLAEQVRDAHQAGQLLGDFIMDTKSYRREIAERIADRPSPIDNEDLERFIGHLLSEVQTSMKQQGDIFQLTFRGDFHDTHRRRFFAGGPKLNAVFRPDRRPDAEDVEFMAFGHRIIDEIVTQILDEQYEGVTGTRRIRESKELPCTAGWLFTCQFTIPGVRAEEQLVPVFVSDEREVSEKTGQLLIQRACRFAQEGKIERAAIPDNLDMIESVVNQFASARREELQHKAEKEAGARIEREVARLQARFDYRERVAQDRLAATRATLQSIQSSDDETQRRILPAWEANLRRDESLPDKLAEERRRQIAEVKRHRYPMVDWALKSLGRIEVVAAV